MACFKAILFDLFGTVLHFAPLVPNPGAERIRRLMTMTWLKDAVNTGLPEVDFDAFREALISVSRQIQRDHAPEYREVSSPEKFCRALHRLGIDGKRAVEVASRLATEHMRHLAGQVRRPEGHVEILEALREDYRLGLVSNFDHQPTAQSILEEHGIAGFFESILISDGFGRRKPHPAIFNEILRRMELRPEEALFIGDSVPEDVVGAQCVGLAAVWINAEGVPYPEGLMRPSGELRSLRDLPQMLERL